jgi:alpha-tubulin suppressor-like RCC1 family protein
VRTIVRSNSTITDIKGNKQGTLILEGFKGALWYVSKSGDVELISSSGVASVSVGEAHAAILFSSGNVGMFYTYGDKAQQPSQWEWIGQFGVGVKPEYVSGVMMTDLQEVTDLSCGNSFTMALRSDGMLLAAGDNSSGVFGNGTYSAYKRDGVFQAVQRDVVGVTAGPDWCFVKNNDGLLYKTGSNNRYECGDKAGGSRRDEPCLPALVGIPDAVISTNVGRSIAIDNNGDVWHTGCGMGRDNWPVGYHLRRRTEWELVPELHLKSVLVGLKCETMAINHDGEILSCGTGNTRKFGQWHTGDSHLFGNRLFGEQIALTPNASFVKADGVWLSSYEKNPHGGLSLRDDPEGWSYEVMLHPADWIQVSSLQNLGINEADAVRAAIALA